MAGNSTCGCGGCGCSACQPANTIFDCPGVDPGILDFGRHLLVLDYQFNERRLQNSGGLLNAEQLGGGAWQLGFSNRPKVTLELVTAIEGAEFGSIVILGPDLRMRKVIGPAVALKFLQTNATGELIFDDLPAQPVPDPLTLTTLNVTTANVTDLNTTGVVTLDNIATAAQSFFLGLNAANEIVKFANAGTAAAMFFESATSPAATFPNDAIGAGNYLIIGNTLYDSGASLIAVTNSTTLTVTVPGKYVLVWSASFNKLAGANRPGAYLEINGIVVNQGPGMPVSAAANNNAYLSQTGFELRTLAAGDVIRLINGPTSSPAVFQARLGALKFAD